MRACNKIVMIHQLVPLREFGRLTVGDKECTGTTWDMRLNRIARQKDALAFIDQLSGHDLKRGGTAHSTKCKTPSGVTKRCELGKPCPPKNTLLFVASWFVPAVVTVGALGLRGLYCGLDSGDVVG